MVQSSSPYKGLPKSAFWQTGVTQSSPFALEQIYTKKWAIDPAWRIATAGSCFAQHISRHLKRRGLNVLDVEPPPFGLPEAKWRDFGYDMYSARFGNIYTVHQLLQLVREAAGGYVPELLCWEMGDRVNDSQRPSVEPEGYRSISELMANRRQHLDRVAEMVRSMDLFIFTLGLTETWQHRASGTVYPTAPGTICGSFEEAEFQFKNLNFPEIVEAFEALLDQLRAMRPDGSVPRVMLTVSPVPLTATASGSHVLSATTYSKSVLRAVAGYLTERYEFVDYFPSYEIVTNQAARGFFYEPNLRSIRSEAVESVMGMFFAEHVSGGATVTHPPIQQGVSLAPDCGSDYVKCDEVLLEAFNAAA